MGALLRLGLPVLLGSCATPTVAAPSVSCTVAAVPGVTEALPGATITLSGGPFTATWDTVVRLGGAEADVLAVSRDACPPCDACRADHGCTTCGTCDACVDLCTACTESVDVRVPALAAGPHDLVLYNRFGASTPASVAVLAPPPDTDAGGTDVPVDTDAGGTDVPVDTDAGGTDVPVDTDAAADTLP